MDRDKQVRLGRREDKGPGEVMTDGSESQKGEGDETDVRGKDQGRRQENKGSREK